MATFLALAGRQGRESDSVGQRASLRILDAELSLSSPDPWRATLKAMAASPQSAAGAGDPDARRPAGPRGRALAQGEVQGFDEGPYEGHGVAAREDPAAADPPPRMSARPRPPRRRSPAKGAGWPNTPRRSRAARQQVPVACSEFRLASRRGLRPPGAPPRFMIQPRKVQASGGRPLCLRLPCHSCANVTGAALDLRDGAERPHRQPGGHDDLECPSCRRRRSRRASRRAAWASISSMGRTR
jgi:hypothetical protein